MKILVASVKPFAPVAIMQMREIIESAGYKLAVLVKYKGAKELLTAVSDTDALIVRSDLVTSELLDAAKKLKIIVRAGTGVDNIDLPGCTAHKVVAMNTPGQNSNAVAELVFEMMLFQARHGFKGKSGSELRTRTIGIHGFGNVGRYVARIAKGFGMKIYSFDPFVNNEVFESYDVQVCNSPEELYSECQYISLHLPVTEKTIKSINYSLLMSMPVNAVLVNTARKEIIDEVGLLKIFEERSDFRYLSDIEPDCKAVLKDEYQGRFLFTAKKMGAQTEEANIKALLAAASQIVDYFKTGNEKFKVNN
jgi:D-3-phosphoglycerate dehydrogenase / 2-oxoglutarate reductase